MNMGILKRIINLEKLIAKKNYLPGDEDGFITALGVNKEDFLRPGGGYDFIAALNSTAAETWENTVL